MKRKILLSILSSSLLLSLCVFIHDKAVSHISYEDERDLVEESLEDVPTEVEEYQGDETLFHLLSQKTRDEITKNASQIIYNVKYNPCYSK